MRLAALYSGGKDSTLAMYLAVQMGHDVPYLVNIVPDDEESWIFHTPNLDVVPLMAESMGIELVRASSSGTEEGDMACLRDALSGLDVEGVVAGAVWSDYQWDRMNAVCGDLGLKLIAPLWRKDQDAVLEEIIDSGIQAVIVGCYAEGLDESWLGRPIGRDAGNGLRALRSKHGISVIGEGGEYESLTLDSPLHSRPLEIVSSVRDVRSSSCTLRVTKARLRPGCARSP
ncbi:MAG: diphthine--ammonia ligase [Candidatus Methanoplasma sp.]|jgi:ABC transporter with metal-binding/Fe-S-binding domain ATP-binding protein|nr:diphthine--ammonia ligase [Candidatus Methanoplasma sp.]